MTVDVEDYFQVEAFSGVVKRDDWDGFAGHVVQNTLRLLDIFGSFHVQGTFFVLGYVAERHPELVRSIHDAGHEVASHGYDHTMVTGMSPEEFRLDVRRSKRILEEITGTTIDGYRAPTFSIMERTSWAFEILVHEGYGYSSSVYPVHHDRYGWPEFGPNPRVVASNTTATLLEIPLSVSSFAGMKIPFGGGGYLRAYPLTLTMQLFRKSLRKGLTPVVYLHPWEIDTTQPAIRAPFASRLRHSLGIPGMERKIEALLGLFEFSSIRNSSVFHQHSCSKS